MDILFSLKYKPENGNVENEIKDDKLLLPRSEMPFGKLKHNEKKNENDWINQN
jgi:hypothetical protein